MPLWIRTWKINFNQSKGVKISGIYSNSVGTEVIRFILIIESKVGTYLLNKKKKFLDGKNVKSC